MADETITLYGGPRDGHKVEWRGGDTAEFPVYKRVLSIDFDAKNEPQKFETFLYRRSLRNRSIFVFQP